jgi:nucleotide-binding universal stress UspA family protein
MLNLKSILYPTDFSEYSLAALPYAVGLVQQYHATLHCLHVVDLEHEQHLTSEYRVPLEMPHVPKDKLLRTARVRLDRFITERLSKIDKVNSRLVSGAPFEEIIRHAVDHEIDLIVLGTHGQSTVDSMLLGSVARKVVAKAPCPVLTVRHRC